mmetsp:Transcript_72291/g.182890  ORF Transcript_72291/g.182890 Transcript_72291/m.182890 type:complete len:203 (+) Transcript_72291:966-1574(+)
MLEGCPGARPLEGLRVRIVLDLAYHPLGIRIDAGPREEVLPLAVARRPGSLRHTSGLPPRSVRPADCPLQQCFRFQHVPGGHEERSEILVLLNFLHEHCGDRRHCPSGREIGVEAVELRQRAGVSLPECTTEVLNIHLYSRPGAGAISCSRLNGRALRGQGTRACRDRSIHHLQPHCSEVPNGVTSWLNHSDAVVGTTAVAA